MNKKYLDSLNDPFLLRWEKANIAYFVFRNERNLQKTRSVKLTKVMPMNSQIVMTIFLSLFILMSANYFIDTILY